MARGGKREGAGRKAGAATRKSREAADALAQEGLLPLDYLVGVMRGTEMFDTNKFEAAKQAAPYMHPKLASVAVGGPGGEGPIVVEIVKRTYGDDTTSRKRVG